MKRPLPSLRLTVAAIVGLATALPAAAQFAKPEDAIKYRKSVMTLQFNHFGRIAAMANGKVPFDAKVAAENAEVLATIVRLAPAGFVDGSDKGETKAKPEIWTEMDKFRANAKLALPLERVEKILDLVQHLEQLPSTRQLGDLLIKR